MDVATPASADRPGWSVVTPGLGLALSGALVLPGVVMPGYARAVAAAVVLFGAAFAARVLLAALLVVVGSVIGSVGPTVSGATGDAPRQPPDGGWPDVSVVVTAYNEADVLPETIAACRALDYPDDALEVVVSYEAASEDATGALARAAAERDPRVRVVERSDPPAGKAAAANHAIADATGDVIASLDADQRPEPEALRRAVRWFEDDDVWCVKGRCFGTNARESIVALCATVERAVVERAEFPARDRLGGFAPFTGGQAFVRADAIDRIGSFDESVLLEDVDMAYRLQRAGGEIRIDPGVVTAETNPATFAGWWNQRKRWARGGMQVARRYLGRELLTGPPSPAARLDFAATLSALVAVPLLAAAAPLVPLALWSGAGPSLPLWAKAGLGVLLAGPILASYLVLAVDALEGRRHGRLEYLAPVLLWGYFAVQTAAVVVAFLAEFVLDRPSVYVTSTAPGRRATGGTDQAGDP